MNDVEHIKNKIRTNGYMTATQITLELAKSLDSKQIKEVLKKLVGKEFHKVEYTNKYVAPYTTKTLYFYNPNIKKRTRKKATKKK